MPEWISKLIEDWADEEENDAWPLMLLRNEGRNPVWAMSVALGVDSRGVPGQACRLLEVYLATQMRVYRTMALDREEGYRFTHQLMSRIPLVMVSCIQLAAKMNSADFQVNASYIRACLIFKGLRFSVADINESEFHVYSTLGFRVPLWNNVDVAEMMAVDAGMPEKMLPGIELVVNVAECRRDVLVDRVRWAADLSPRCSNDTRHGTLRTLHMIAGCVVATARYLNFKGPDMAPRLAELTRAPLCYIRCISDCVLTIIHMNEKIPSSPNSRKRHRQQVHRLIESSPAGLEARGKMRTGIGPGASGRIVVYAIRAPAARTPHGSSYSLPPSPCWTQQERTQLGGLPIKGDVKYHASLKS